MLLNENMICSDMIILNFLWVWYAKLPRGLQSVDACGLMLQADFLWCDPLIAFQLNASHVSIYCVQELSFDPLFIMLDAWRIQSVSLPVALSPSLKGWWRKERKHLSYPSMILPFVMFLSFPSEEHNSQPSLIGWSMFAILMED